MRGSASERWPGSMKHSGNHPETGEALCTSFSLMFFLRQSEENITISILEGEPPFSSYTMFLGLGGFQSQNYVLNIVWKETASCQHQHCAGPIVRERELFRGQQPRGDLQDEC